MILLLGLQVILFIIQIVLVILHFFDPFKTWNEYDVEIVILGMIIMLLGLGIKIL